MIRTFLSKFPLKEFNILKGFTDLLDGEVKLGFASYAEPTTSRRKL
jgi:hypothetical protein